LKSEIDKEGYIFLEKIDEADLSKILGFIDLRYKEIMSRTLAASVTSSILYYENFTQITQHGPTWTKRNRCLPSQSVNEILAQRWICDLKNRIGPFSVSDEELLGYGNMYFRLIRTNALQDTGPLHRDAWFWELNETRTPERLKIWIPVITGGEETFLFVPRSHLSEDYKYEIQLIQGMRKPRIVNSPKPDLLQRFGRVAGQPILFHDRLIHGGTPAKLGIRVSLEFTLLLSNET